VVLSITEAFAHPQALARSMRVRLPDDEFPAGIEVANTALRFSVSEPVPALLAPVPGRDAKSIAAELGLDAAAAEPDSPAARWGRKRDPAATG
jgi:crotonobetainyl-CoA:carnitine CoA-transferase CaiB-like acyl-CoA transferase